MSLKESVVPYTELKDVLETRILAETGIALSKVELPFIQPSHGSYVTVPELNDYLNELEGSLKKLNPSIELGSIRTRVSAMVVERQPRGGTPQQAMRSIN